MDKLPEIIIGGRTIPLHYSTYETIAIQSEIGCTAFQLKDEVFGVEKIDEDGDETLGNIKLDVAKDTVKMMKMGKLIRILGNAGLEESGQEPDLTDKWVLRHLKPALVLPMALILIAIINDAMMMEKAETDEKENGPVDVTIEDENRKKEPRK